jgi:hypothetical protein
MYLQSNTPIMAQQTVDQAVHGAESDARILCTKMQAARGRLNSYETLISPEQAAQIFGAQSGANVALMQQQTQASRASGLLAGMVPDDTVTSTSGDPSVAQVVSSAPVVIPLNRNQARCSRTIVETRLPNPQPTPTMPEVAPTMLSTPAGQVSVQPATQPHWNNLCWALRNGAVDASQFDKTELWNLAIKCGQMGYAGACVAPPDVLAWLVEGRANGTLPHISVSQADLDAIPQAPPLSAVPCTQSYAMGGLSGIAPPWSNAWVMPIDDSQDYPTSTPGLFGWIQSHPWLSLAIAGGAALAIGRSGGQ